jgi:predicted nucleotidyltransferase
MRALRGRNTRFNQLLEDKRGEILRIAAEYGAREVRVFGSVARGEADQESDIDFLVELETGRSLMDLGGLQMELESPLGRRVDVVTARGLKARIRERVLREAVPVCSPDMVWD